MAGLQRECRLAGPPGRTVPTGPLQLHTRRRQGPAAGSRACQATLHCPGLHLRVLPGLLGRLALPLLRTPPDLGLQRVSPPHLLLRLLPGCRQALLHHVPA